MCSKGILKEGGDGNVKLTALCDIGIDDSGGECYAGILKNFADAVLNGKELFAPGEESIKGLTISNAIHLSAWTGERVNVNNFPYGKFYALLQDKIKNPTVVKKENKVVVDITNTH